MCLQLRMGPSSSPIHASLVAENTESAPSPIVALAQRKASPQCVPAASGAALFVSRSRGIKFGLTLGGGILKRNRGPKKPVLISDGRSEVFRRRTTTCRKSTLLNFNLSSD